MLTPSGLTTKVSLCLTARYDKMNNRAEGIFDARQNYVRTHQKLWNKRRPRVIPLTSISTISGEEETRKSRSPSKGDKTYKWSKGPKKQREILWEVLDDKEYDEEYEEEDEGIEYDVEDPNVKKKIYPFPISNNEPRIDSINAEAAKEDLC